MQTGTKEGIRLGKRARPDAAIADGAGQPQPKPPSKLAVAAAGWARPAENRARRDMGVALDGFPRELVALVLGFLEFRLTAIVPASPASRTLVDNPCDRRSGELVDMAASPDHSEVYTVWTDRVVRVFDSASGAFRRQFGPDEGAWYSCLALAVDDDTGDLYVAIWVNSIAEAPQAKAKAKGTGVRRKGGAVQVWTQRGRLVRTIEFGLRYQPSAMRVRGSFLFVLHNDLARRDEHGNRIETEGAEIKVGAVYDKTSGAPLRPSRARYYTKIYNDAMWSTRVDPDEVEGAFVGRKLTPVPALILGRMSTASGILVLDSSTFLYSGHTGDLTVGRTRLRNPAPPPPPLPPPLCDISPHSPLRGRKEEANLLCHFADALPGEEERPLIVANHSGTAELRRLAVNGFWDSPPAQGELPYLRVRDRIWAVACRGSGRVRVFQCLCNCFD